jgi:hypothetical protein
VRLRIAEVHQQAITEVLCNIAVKALDHGGAGGLIGAHHLAVVFWVELPGEDGRIRQVAEQDGELTAFGVGRAWDLSSRGGRDIRHRRRLVWVVVLGRTL